MKKLWISFVIFIILVAVFTFTKNIIARIAITSGVKAMTGLNLEINGVSVGILKTSLNLNDLKILNPEGFKEKIMADLPEIYVDYSLAELFKGKTHFHELRISLKEVVVVRNQENQVNIKSLKPILPKADGRAPKIQVDTLNLKIGKVVYKDYILGNPDLREFNININENFKNINDPNALVSLILVRALSRTNIAGLANIDLEGLRQQVSEVIIQKAEGAAQRLEQKAAETLDKIFQPQQ